MLGRVWQRRREGLTSKASFHQPLWILGPVAVDQGAQSLLCRFAAQEMLPDDSARGPAFEAIYWVLERHKRVTDTNFWVAISSTEIPMITMDRCWRVAQGAPTSQGAKIKGIPGKMNLTLQTRLARVLASRPIYRGLPSMGYRLEATDPP